MWDEGDVGGVREDWRGRKGEGGRVRKEGLRRGIRDKGIYRIDRREEG